MRELELERERARESVQIWLSILFPDINYRLTYTKLKFIIQK